MKKTSHLYVRIEPDLKKEAEEILAGLHLTSSSAINLFYTQIVLNRGLPFEIKFPPEEEDESQGAEEAVKE